MANGVETMPTTLRKHGEARRWKNKREAFSKKIACQFTPEQFSQINTFADSKMIPFAAAVRRLIFEAEALPSREAK